MALAWQGLNSFVMLQSPEPSSVTLVALVGGLKELHS